MEILETTYKNLLYNIQLYNHQNLTILQNIRKYNCSV